MKRLLFGLLIIALAGCAPVQTDVLSSADAPQEQEVSVEPAMPKLASLPDLGPAPELTNETWLNVDSPLRIADLRGKVVIVEMWTFGCINCQNVMPSLKDWHSKYAEQGLVIIGNHYPEFGYEADLANLEDAVSRFGIKYPVAQDNDGATWRAYKNHYWPTLYLIDKQGRIRYVHIGEGRYAETEENIQALLEETY
ncbi:MAG TPA: redoxin domain-containing protein [Anaerolineales bacterium]|nr:redoxin domain-containing protein [Anaerolineales bacterium]